MKLGIQMKDEMPFCLMSCNGLSNLDCKIFCTDRGFDSGFCDHYAGHPPYNMCCCQAA